ENTPGALLVGGIDNFTRWSHSHGQEVAEKVWRLSAAGFSEMEAFCKQQGVPFQKGKRIRLILSEHEAREGRQAVQELNAAGYPAHFQDPYPWNDPSVLAVQEDGTEGAIIETSLLLQKLAAYVPMRQARVVRLEPGRRVTVHLADQSEIDAEVVL